MTSKAKVAALFTRPETAITDYQRLFQLAGGAEALQPAVTTILKGNITWHFPIPGANTTPWQLEGTILALREAGISDMVCVQNQTVVTDAFKGEYLAATCRSPITAVSRSIGGKNKIADIGLEVHAHCRAMAQPGGRVFQQYRDQGYLMDRETVTAIRSHDI